MTAVQFFITELTKLNFDNINNESIILSIKPIYDAAKEMEKEQKIKFAEHCLDKALDLDIRTAFSNLEQYYNETFKPE